MFDFSYLKDKPDPYQLEWNERNQLDKEINFIINEIKMLAIDNKNKTKIIKKQAKGLKKCAKLYKLLNFLYSKKVLRLNAFKVVDSYIYELKKNY